jgi:hypothetical protein
MKHLFYILFLLIILVGCIKDDRQASDETTVWKETDYFFSAGGAPTWHKTENSKEEVIQFKTNNVFSSSERTNLNRYIMQPIDAASANLKLYEEGKTDTIHWTIYNITQNTMEAGFFGCIEGCGKRFVRL